MIFECVCVVAVANAFSYATPFLALHRWHQSGRPATFFGESGPTGASQATGGMPNGDPVRSKEAELVIKRSLLVGNFEAAVQCCMAAGHPADALLLARYGDIGLVIAWFSKSCRHFIAGNVMFE